MHSPRTKTRTTVDKDRLDLGGDPGLGVGDLDAQLLGAGDDVDALSGGNVVGDPIHSQSASQFSVLQPIFQ